MMDEPDSGEEYIDIQPWPVQVLVGRLVSLVTLGRRGILEAQEADDPFEAETDRFDLQSWAALELQTALTTEEARILSVPVTELTDDDLAACADALSAAAAIAWALRVLPKNTLPIPSDPGDDERVLEWSPKPWTKVRPIARSVRVRSDDELAHERVKWEIVTWRLSLFQDPADSRTDRAALTETIAEASAAGLLRNDGTDFLTDAGETFARMTDDELLEIEHLAEIRLRTLNWVCGFGEDWDSAPLLLD
ncbi:MAG: hypothetical protein M3440_01400 [Chloroflexota bacterium]|nr:hypothetical protein [Chloroflexota bacterium]